MSDPDEALERLYRSSKSRNLTAAKEWGYAFLGVTGFIFGFVLIFRLVVGPGLAGEKHRENILGYCKPAPTAACQRKVLRLHEKCYEKVSGLQSTRTNVQSLYHGCMAHELPGYFDKVKTPAATPGLDLSR